MFNVYEEEFDEILDMIVKASTKPLSPEYQLSEAIKDLIVERDSLLRSTKSW
jgi:hypothetical protein